MTRGPGRPAAFPAPHQSLTFDMATPTLTRHRLPGVLGEILIDVRAGGRETPRPAVVVIHGFKGFKDWGLWPSLGERMARAGFSTVTATRCVTGPKSLSSNQSAARTTGAHATASNATTAHFRMRFS